MPKKDADSNIQTSHKTNPYLDSQTTIPHLHQFHLLLHTSTCTHPSRAPTPNLPEPDFPPSRYITTTTLIPTTHSTQTPLHSTHMQHSSSSSSCTTTTLDHVVTLNANPLISISQTRITPPAPLPCNKLTTMAMRKMMTLHTFHLPLFLSFLLNNYITTTKYKCHPEPNTSSKNY